MTNKLKLITMDKIIKEHKKYKQIDYNFMSKYNFHPDFMEDKDFIRWGEDGIDVAGIPLLSMEFMLIDDGRMVDKLWVGGDYYSTGIIIEV